MVGGAWEAGALAGLQEAGLRPEDADVIIGTSAGSALGAQLRLGRRDAELMAPYRRTGEGSLGMSPDPETFLRALRLWTSTTEMTPELAREIGAVSLKAPAPDEDAWVGVFEALAGHPWPHRDLWVTAVSCTTGKRRVLTAADGVELVRAVASSCTVPGFFPPVTIDDDRYIDGGVWSWSNADLAFEAGAERVVFVGPIPGPPLEDFVAGSLDRESLYLAAAGLETHFLIPSEEFEPLRANFMDVAVRDPAAEIGLADGRAGAKRLADVLPG